MTTQNSNAEVGDAGLLWVKLLDDIGEGISGAQYDSHYIAEWNSKLNL